jgi:hypothetical protein
MLESAHARKQRVVISVARNGSVKQRLVMETNLTHTSSEIAGFAAEIVDYLKAHPELDGADFCCVTEPTFAALQSCRKA